MNPKIIALYLPQFHPFKENDEWWGKGFTEWTNVGKARPLFRGHYQPRVPADLGYYDLRLPIVREQQAELAREAGVTAFCYWHYWFGNGRRLMANIFQEVLDSGKPNFPFCLAWANHTWRAVGCTADNADPKVLMEQTYPGLEDAKAHFEYLLTAFRDKRYVKVKGKPYLFIFDAISLPQLYIDTFKKMAVEAGFPGLFLVANVGNNSVKKEDMMARGYDAVCYCDLLGASDHTSFGFKVRKHLESILLHRPTYTYDYRKIYRHFISKVSYDPDVIPQIVPQWDHSPRTGRKGIRFIHSTPEFFKRHVRMALDSIQGKPEERQILMLKSWNEWAEGNYMEPDLRYGKGFINALHEVIEEYKNK